MQKCVAILAGLAVLTFMSMTVYAESKPIVIGVPLSTAYPTGWVPERGIKLAAEEINAAGGVNLQGAKRQLKLEVMDTRDLEPGVPVVDTLMVIEKLILQKDAKFLLGGPVRSEATMAAMDLVSRYKTVQILAAGSISPAIAAKIEKNLKKYKYTFRISGTAEAHVRSAVTVLMRAGGQHKLKKIFFVVQDSAYARRGTEILRKIMEKNGWQVTGYETYPVGSTDFSSALLKARQAGRGVLLVWMEMPEGAVLAKQWYEMKVPALLVGAPLEVAGAPDFWKSTNGRAESIIGIMTHAGNVACEATPKTMQFVNAYQKKYGTLPDGSFASSGYTSVYLLKDALERAGTTDTDAVITALEKSDMQAPSGQVRFNPKNHDAVYGFNPKEGLVVGHFQWQAGGKMAVINPPTIATGKIELPPWMRK